MVTGQMGGKLIAGGGSGNDQINLTSGSVVVTINGVEIGHFDGDDAIVVAEDLTQSTVLNEGDDDPSGVALNASTVSEDGAVDVLTGSADNDWFLFDEDDDGDCVTDLNDEVFTSDLDWINQS